MDNCKEIKDLILTDYVDARLNGLAKERLQRHLDQCASCQAFAREARENLVKPFDKAQRQEVPPHLWSAIQEKIFNEGYQKAGVLDLIRGWLEGITLPRLVPALCSVAMIIFIGSTVFLKQQIKQAQSREQGVYLAYVLDSEAVAVENQDNDWETPIEQYFL